MAQRCATGPTTHFVTRCSTAALAHVHGPADLRGPADDEGHTVRAGRRRAADLATGHPRWGDGRGWDAAAGKCAEVKPGLTGPTHSNQEAFVGDRTVRRR
jgi:hypothetical protein